MHRYYYEYVCDMHRIFWVSYCIIFMSEAWLKGFVIESRCVNDIYGDFIQYTYDRKYPKPSPSLQVYFGYVDSLRFYFIIICRLIYLYISNVLLPAVAQFTLACGASDWYYSGWQYR